TISIAVISESCGKTCTIKSEFHILSIDLPNIIPIIADVDISNPEVFLNVLPYYIILILVLISLLIVFLTWYYMKTDWKNFWRFLGFLSIIVCSIFGVITTFDFFIIYSTNNPIDPLPETTAILLQRFFISFFLIVLGVIVVSGTVYLSYKYIYKEFLNI
ncbi:hypothetical protein LCGC14_2022590, partial [marine sediment metagenome]